MLSQTDVERQFVDYDRSFFMFKYALGLSFRRIERSEANESFCDGCLSRVPLSVG